MHLSAFVQTRIKSIWGGKIPITFLPKNLNSVRKMSLFTARLAIGHLFLLYSMGFPRNKYYELCMSNV